MRNLLFIVLVLLASCAPKINMSTREFSETRYQITFKETKRFNETTFVKYEDQISFRLLISQEDPRAKIWVIDYNSDLKADAMFPCFEIEKGKIMVYEGVERDTYEYIYEGQKERIKDIRHGFKICDKMLNRGYNKMGKELK